LEQFFEFRERYKIESHIESGYSGFSATLFYDTHNDNKPILAFRGTEENQLQDLFQDLLLSLGLSEVSPQNQSLHNAIKSWIDEGLITSDNKMTVVGHSLGGHLSLKAASHYPELVDRVYTFNGAGVSGWDALHTMENIDPNIVDRVVAEPGLEVTANGITFHQVSDGYRLFIGKQPLLGDFLSDVSIGNHSMVHLVDTLSVLRVLELLSPDSTVEELDEILWEFHNRKTEKIIHSLEDLSNNGSPDLSDPESAAISLNTLTYHLAKILGGDFSPYSSTNQATELYNALTEAEGVFTLAKLNDFDDALTMLESGTSNAATAMRYALLENVPFVLFPHDGYDQGIFANTTANELYAPGQHSLSFWSDRLDYYFRMLERNARDIQDGEFGSVVGSGTTHFHDLQPTDTPDANEQTRNPDYIRGSESASLDNSGSGSGGLTDLGGLFNPHVFFGSDDGDEIDGKLYVRGDRIYGMGGDDVLRGHDGADLIEGGQGNDTLIGGNTNDWLYGGEGDDRYEFFTGDDHDIVRDASGNDAVLIDSSQITSLQRIAHGSSVFRNINESDQRIYLETGEGLLMTTEGSVDTILFEGWTSQNGRYGISVQPGADQPDSEFFAEFEGVDTGEIGMIVQNPSIPDAFRYWLYDVQGDVEWTSGGGTLRSEEFSEHQSLHMSSGNGHDELNGMQSNDWLEGGAGNDLLVGDSSLHQEFLGNWTQLDNQGQDRLSGGDGLDYVVAGFGADTIEGGTGSDFIDAGLANDIVDGGSGVDILSGSAGSDTIFGGSDDDLIFGDLGIENSAILNRPEFWFEMNHQALWGVDFSFDQEGYLVGKDVSGVDIYGDDPGLAGDDTLAGGDGNDWIEGDSGNDALFGNADNDQLVGGAGGDYLHGGSGNDILIGDDALDQYEGEDDLYGGEGNDRLSGGKGGDHLFGGTGDDLLEGGAAIDFLYGGEGRDRLDGGQGDDEIRGGLGNDILLASAGIDTFYFRMGDGHDSFEGNESDLIDDVLVFGSGISRDDVILDQSGANTVLNLGEGGSLSFSGQDYVRRWIFGGTIIQHGSDEADLMETDDRDEEVYLFEGNDTVNTFAGSDYVWAGAGDDTALLGDGDDIGYGEEGADQLSGQGGNDFLAGGNGNDTLIGGSGNDQLAGDDGDDFLHADGGDDLLQGGAGQDSLYGGAGDDELFGGAGNDHLDGGDGTDQLIGGEGQNVYYFGRGSGQDYIQTRPLQSLEQGNSFIVFKSGLTIDDLDFSLSGRDLVIEIVGEEDRLTVHGFYQNPELAGTDFGEVAFLSFEDSGESLTVQQIHDGMISVVFSQNDDVWFGTSERDVVNAGWGDDVLYGLGGNDRMEGSDGADQLYGHQGNDFMYGDGGNDHLDGGSGNDDLFGGYGNDLLVGGIGEDELEGGLGRDVYRFALGDGNDRVLDTDSTQQNDSRIEFSEGIGLGNVQFHRDGQDLLIEYGFSGDQIRVEKWLWAGRNQVSLVQFADGTSLSAAEILSKLNVRLEGTELDDDIQGANFIDDVIYAGAGNDLVSAGDGTDQLFGESGDDELVGGDGNDLLNGGSGNDTLMGDGGNDSLSGGEGDDVLYGTSGNNYLDGGRGNDTLHTSIQGTNVVHFDIGDGNDLMVSGGQSVLQFGPDISPTDLNTAREGDDLIFELSGGIDSVRVGMWFVSENNELSQIQFADGTVWTGTDLTDIFTVQSGTLDDDVILGTRLDDVLHGLGGADHLEGRRGDDLIQGGDGDDFLHGGHGSNVLVGGAGDDQLYAYRSVEGENVFEGGQGNDTVSADYGVDVYRFALGDGQDVINDAGGVDRIEFASPINRDAIYFRLDGNNLVVAFYDSDDQITIQGWANSDSHKIETLVFGDATTMSHLDIDAALTVIHGTNQDDMLTGSGLDDTIVGHGGNDTVYGNAGDDLLYGSDGDDVLFSGDGADLVYGESGNDVLHGESSQDQLFGGDGDDILNGAYYTLLSGGKGADTLYGQRSTYLYNLGDGHDSIRHFAYYGNASNEVVGEIQFGSGILASQLGFERDGSDLIISFATPEDQITLVDWFANEFRNVRSLRFDDGAIMDYSEINALFSAQEGSDQADVLIGSYLDDTLTGLGGDDTLIAGAGNDTLHGGDGSDLLTVGQDDLLRGGNNIFAGGSGDDQMIGGVGADAYFFNLGDGADTITDKYQYVYGSGEDRIIFGANIRLEDLAFRKVENDLVVNHSNGLDQLTIRNWFVKTGYYYVHRIETFEFADGSALSADDAEALTSISATPGDDIIQLFEPYTQIDGLAGDDHITGSEGNDQILGGEGNDVIVDTDTAGDDVLQGDFGNDSLYIGGGKNTIVFGVGDGTDLIEFLEPQYAADRVRFVAGVSRSDVQLSQVDQTLIIALQESDDSLRIANAFDSDGYTGAIRELEFFENGEWVTVALADFTVVSSNAADLVLGDDGNQAIATLGGDDQIYASGGDDVIDAGEGDDLIRDGRGMDHITGGPGNDLFINGGDNDYFVFASGDGKDEIQQSSGQTGREVLHFTDAVNNAAFEFERQANDLIIRHGDGDQLRWREYFEAGQESFDSNLLIGIEHGDGEIVHSDIVDALSGLNAFNNYYVADSNNNLLDGLEGNDSLLGLDGHDSLYGSGGDDFLYGGNGDDILIGGVGDDLLDGGSGQNTIQLFVGDGNDRLVQNSGANNTVSFGSGITLENLSVSKVYDSSGNPHTRIHYGSGDSLEVGDLGYGFVDAIYFSETGSGTDETFFRQEMMDVFGVDIEAAGSNAEAIQITGRGGQDTGINDDRDRIFGGNANEEIRGITGDDILYGGDGNDVIYGGLGDSILYGEQGNDALYGGRDPVYYGSFATSRSTLVGGIGNDYLSGHENYDTYLFEQGDGQDHIYDQGGDEVSYHSLTDVVRFGESVQSDSVSFDFSGNDLMVLYGETDSILIEEYFTQGQNGWQSGDHTIERIEFANGSAYDVDDLIAFRTQGNMGPVQVRDLPSLSIQNRNALWSYQIPEDSFFDLNGDTMQFSVSNLPIWLDLENGLLTGTPTNTDVGEYTLNLRVSDGQTALNTDIQLSVSGENNSARLMNNTISSVTTDEDALFNWTLPNNLFIDPDGDALTYTMMQNDGSALPDWLSFDGLMLTGLPDNDSVGVYALQIVASDGLAQVSRPLDLQVLNTNDAPFLIFPQPDLYVEHGQSHSYDLDAGMFADVDAGDGLSISLELVGGAQLPTWLSFNPETLRLQINPTKADMGVWDFEIAATDEAGSSIATGFSLFVGESVDAPVEFVGGSQADEAYGASNDDLLDGKGGSDSLYGLAGDDTLYGRGGNDFLDGGDGNDSLYGNGGRDTLLGGFGNDTLKAGNGNDTLEGGKGDDLLVGGIGNDTYLVEREGGYDRINNASKKYETEVDELLLGGDIVTDELWFSRQNNHLDIYLLGSESKVRVNNWYKAPKFELDIIRAGDEWIASEAVEQLVQALSAYGQPVGGQINLTENQRQEVESVIASAWQTA